MKPTPVRNPRGRFGAVASLAMVVCGSVACVGEGEISGGPGTATGKAGTGVVGPGTGTAGNQGAGGVKPVDPTMPQAMSWFEPLKAANCSDGGAAVPSSRIYRLSAVQWKNTV